MNTKPIKRITTVRAPLLTVAVLLAAWAVQPVTAADEGIYKSVGPDGSIIFTDKPRGSTAAFPLRQSAPQTRSQPVLDTSVRSGEFSSDTLGGRKNQKINISAMRITTPANNETLVDLDGFIVVAIALGPDKNLPEGYSAEIQINGEVVANGRRLQANIPVPDTGTHVLEARIMNSNGVTLVQSEPVRVYIE